MPSRIRKRVELGPRAAASARRSLDALRREVPEEAIDDLRLLVSELVTNSFRHSGLGTGDAALLTVDVNPRRVHVEVEDRGHGFGTQRFGAVGFDRGWGLTIVDRVSDRWGVVEDDSTKVWFEVDLPRTPAAAAGA